MSNDDLKRSRAGSGGRAAATSPKRFAPLRKVVSKGGGVVETLECGHTQTAVFDMIGQTYAERRRCLTCLEEMCAEAGHPLDVERGNSPTCKCGQADGAVSHLVWDHSVGGTPQPLRPLADHLPDHPVNLAWAEGQHASHPATRHHEHRANESPWQCRYRNVRS